MGQRTWGSTEPLSMAPTAPYSGPTQPTSLPLHLVASHVAWFCERPGQKRPCPWEVTNVGLMDSSEPPNGKMAAAESVNPKGNVGGPDYVGK